MRTYRPVAALLFVAALASPALADKKADGAYEVKFEEMSTNCDPLRFAYQRGTVKIETQKNTLVVNITTGATGAMIPQMAGGPGKSGKISAKTLKKSATTVQGLDGTYRVSGRVDDSGGDRRETPNNSSTRGNYGGRGQKLPARRFDHPERIAKL